MNFQGKKRSSDILKKIEKGKNYNGERYLQPRPQGAFPWLWEKRPGDEVVLPVQFIVVSQMSLQPDFFSSR